MLVHIFTSRAQNRQQRERGWWDKKELKVRTMIPSPERVALVLNLSLSKPLTHCLFFSSFLPSPFHSQFCTSSKSSPVLVFSSYGATFMISSSATHPPFPPDSRRMCAVFALLLVEPVIAKRSKNIS